MRVLLVTGIICCGVALFAPVALELDEMASGNCRCPGCATGDCRTDYCNCAVQCLCGMVDHSAQMHKSKSKDSDESDRLATQPDHEIHLRERP